VTGAPTGFDNPPPIGVMLLFVETAWLSNVVVTVGTVGKKDARLFRASRELPPTCFAPGSTDWDNGGTMAPRVAAGAPNVGTGARSTDLREGAEPDR
jgi:hypothetical protein